MHYRLLKQFEHIFHQGPYRHRRNTLGDSVAIEWYEDWYSLAVSAKYNQAIEDKILVANTRNVVTGKMTRRGDGALGELVPGASGQLVEGFRVRRGPIATLRAGVEVKILAKAMIKQIDRVINDLQKQARAFRSLADQAPRIALVGINWSDSYVSYEGERAYPATPPPAKEAPKARQRIAAAVTSFYDEVLFLDFKATNIEPYEFTWVNRESTEQEYGSALLRVSQKFDETFS